MPQFGFWAILIVIARYCPSGEGDAGDGHAGGCPRTKYKAAERRRLRCESRVSEVVALKVSDIDPERLLLRIEQGRAARIACDALPACWTCCDCTESACATVQKWIAQVDRQRPGGGHHGIKLGSERRWAAWETASLPCAKGGARVRRSPIRLVRSRPHASGAEGSFFRPPAPPAS